MRRCSAFALVRCVERRRAKHLKIWSHSPHPPLSRSLFFCSCPIDQPPRNQLHPCFFHLDERAGGCFEGLCRPPKMGTLITSSSHAHWFALSSRLDTCHRPGIFGASPEAWRAAPSVKRVVQSLAPGSFCGILRRNSQLLSEGMMVGQSEIRSEDDASR
jgi:hypothetical protein